MISVAVFSIAGIRVRVHPSWLIAFLLFSWTLAAAYFPARIHGYAAPTYWILGAASSLALFLSVLVHELSHSLVAKRLGIGVRQIVLFIFGGVSEMIPSSMTPETEFRITLAGPVASGILGILFASLVPIAGVGTDAAVLQFLRYLATVNVLLALFNLIPAFPLDGGRLLRSILWHLTGDFGYATRSATRVGRIFAIALVGVGIATILTARSLQGVWLILIGLFLRQAASVHRIARDTSPPSADTRFASSEPGSEDT